MTRARSILYQFGSTTMADRTPGSARLRRVVDAFTSVLRGAQRTLWSDAFMSDRSLATCAELCEGSACFIDNRWVPRQRTAICVGRYVQAKRGLKAALGRLLADGLHTVTVSASKAYAYELTAGHDEAETLVITGDSPDAVKAQMTDVNAMWAQYRNVVFTTCITVGVNFDTPGKFDSLLMYFSAGAANVRDMMQSSMRVRHLNSNRLFYGVWPKYLGDQRYDVLDRVTLRAIIEDRAKPPVPRMDKFDVLYAARAWLPKWLRLVWTINTAEDNASAFHNERLLDKYLAECGYSTGVGCPSR